MPLGSNAETANNYLHVLNEVQQRPAPPVTCSSSNTAVHTFPGMAHFSPVHVLNCARTDHTRNHLQNA